MCGVCVSACACACVVGLGDSIDHRDNDNTVYCRDNNTIYYRDSIGKFKLIL